jgi:5-carboxymethyl-2-hydroxymuconate isomerase
MRYGTAIADEETVVFRDDQGTLYPLDLGSHESLEAAIAAGGALEVHADARPLTGARPIAPIMPGKIVAIGLNYFDHIREAGVEAPKQPLVFTKFTTSVIGDSAAITFVARSRSVSTGRSSWPS